ncbi:MAG: arsenic efflux protein [Oscillospiraceae bacterium]|nr:arsenic efflux protein [Oscillospiraceae bacterium]
MLDALKDALIDTLKITPFLYLTYLCMEYLEAHTEDRIQNLVKRAGWMGPFWGSLLGAVPQCGFSAAASNLYAGRTITLGTLIAIFLSTSDEMLPIMLSESVPVTRILRILLVKVVIGIICGFLIDGFCHLRNSRKTGQPDDGEAFLIERLCEKEHCHCENGSIALSALKHTGNILVFVLAVTFLLNLSFLFLGEDTLNSLVKSKPLPGILISALIGLIPNCGASVLLTQMYLHGILPASHLIAGLLDGAGVGLLILFRVNPEHRQNLLITGLLYLLSVLFGLLLYFLNAAF